MTKKIYRLKENEIKKVLKYKKPFFSYNLVANFIPNRLPYSRFAIFLSSKNTKGSICRNYFRRKFYFSAGKYLDNSNIDVVVSPKKGKIFDKKDKASILGFENDLNFIFKNILRKENLKK